MSDQDFYTEGTYKAPASGVYAKVTLHKPCPTEGHVNEHGLCVATSNSKTAGLLWWPAVIAAVAWAAKRSAAVRADLRRILAEAEPPSE